MGFALRREDGEGGFKVVVVRVEQLVKHAAVFKARIHALPIKGNDGMRRIAEEHGLSAHVPRGAADDDQAGNRVLAPLILKVRHQGKCIAKRLGKEGFCLLRRLECIKAQGAFHGEEEGAGEAAVRIGEGDEHVLAAGPNVQGFTFDLMAAVGARGNVQLFVPVVNVLLLVVEAVAALELRAHLGKSAIRGKNSFALGGDVAVFGGKGGRTSLDIGIHTGMAKVDIHMGMGFRGLDHESIQTSARYRVNGLVFLSVGLKAQVARDVVHDASVHRDGFFPNRLRHAHLFQGRPAAVTQGQVDGTPFRLARLAGVGAAFVHVDGVATFGQIQRPQGAH